MQNEADLVGQRRAARRAIGGELSLVQLDEIFRLPARAVEGVVEPFGRAEVEVGDDEADVEAEPRRLDTCDGAPLLVPGACLVARLGIAAQNGSLSPTARSVRMASAVSSTFLARGLVPGRPKT